MAKSITFTSELAQDDLEELVKEALTNRGYSVNAVTFDALPKENQRGEVYGYTVTAKLSVVMPAKPRQEQWNGDK